MSFRLSVCFRSHGKPLHLLDGFSWYLVYENFSKIFREDSSFHFTLDRFIGTLHKDLCTFVMSRLILLRMSYVSEKSCRENHETHFMCSNFIYLFFKSCSFWDNMEKYCGAGQTTNDNIKQLMRFSYWRPKATNTHTLIVCNTYFFSLATVVTETRLSFNFIRPFLPFLSLGVNGLNIFGTAGRTHRVQPPITIWQMHCNWSTLLCCTVNFVF